MKSEAGTIEIEQRPRTLLGRLRGILRPADTERDARVITTSQVSGAWLYGTAALLLVGVILGNALLFGLGSLLGSVLLLSWLWARYCLAELRVERRFSQGRAFFGEELDMAQVFTNNKILPLPWLAATDEYPGRLEVTSTVDMKEVLNSATRRRVFNTYLSLGWYERLTRHYTVKCTARGEHEFGPVEVQSGDVFGLFRRSEEVGTRQTLIVYPRYVPVEQLGIVARQPFGDSKAAQNLATDPLRLRTIREYTAGDNPRHIHWKASARRGALQTKLFEPAATPQLYIFCNQDTFAKVWEGLDPPALELTITVAASIANFGLEEGYMVGLRVNAFAPYSDTQVKINPSRNPNQLTRILESLARIKGWSGLPVEDLIHAERRAIPRGATLVVVTAVVSDGLLDVLTAVRRAGHPVTLIETVGSQRASNAAHIVSAEALAHQGIVYYLVEAIGQASALKGLSF